LRLSIISDTHELHRGLTIPECDVLIHCGDATYGGELPVLEDLAIWMASTPSKHRIFVAGNHDFSLDPSSSKYNIAAETFFHKEGIHYLFDSAITLDGVKFYGSPWVPSLPMWAFHRRSGQDPWAKIPKSTQVLITHGPPHGILDRVPRSRGHSGMGRDYENVGCERLRNRIDSKELSKLRLHCFGHVHEDGGLTVPVIETEDYSRPRFVNAAVLDDRYDLVRGPQNWEVECTA